MNIRLTMILAVVLLVIAGVAYLGFRGGSNSNNNEGGEDRSFAYRLNADHIVQFGDVLKISTRR